MQPMIQIPQVFTVFDVEEKLDLGSFCRKNESFTGLVW